MLSASPSTRDLLELWRCATAAAVRNNPAADLTARQQAILLTVYLGDLPHTVRGLAEMLRISTPAVTRAADRLEGLGLVRRRPDPADRRSVLLQRTVAGSVYLSDFAATIGGAWQSSPVPERIKISGSV